MFPKDSKNGEDAHFVKIMEVLGPPTRGFALMVSNTEAEADEFYLGCQRAKLSKRSLETEAQLFEGDQKELFTRFTWRCLKWDPTERAKAAELCDDPFLSGYEAVDES